MTELNTLFHYTSLNSWQAIAAAGQIGTTSLAADHLDGDVRLVWLTDSTDPAATALNDPVRTRIRIAVDPAPGIRYWRMWRHLVPNTGALEQWKDPATWYVSPEPIPAANWEGVVDLETGQILRSAPAAPSRAADWGDLPEPGAVDRIETLLIEGHERLVQELAGIDATAAGHQLFRSTLVRLQVGEMRHMLDVPETKQRLRAGWRTLRSEADALPNRSQE